MVFQHVPLSHSDVSDCLNDICRFHILWTTIGACITSSAVPQFLCGNALFFQTKKCLSNNASDKIVGSCSCRTAAAACSALKATLDVWSTSLLNHLNEGLIRCVNFKCNLFFSTRQDNTPTEVGLIFNLKSVTKRSLGSEHYPFLKPYIS
jgi:hypothetical protein